MNIKMYEVVEDRRYVSVDGIWELKCPIEKVRATAWMWCLYMNDKPVGTPRQFRLDIAEEHSLHLIHDSETTKKEKTYVLEQFNRARALMKTCQGEIEAIHRI